MTDSNKAPCPDCGNHYEEIATHWRKSTCSPPPLPTRDRETIVGCLLAGGMLRQGSHSRQAFLEYNTTVEKNTQWLQSRLGYIGTYGTVYTHDRERGTSYRLRTITHPDLYGFHSIQQPGESAVHLPATTDLEGEYEWDRTGSAIELTAPAARTWYALSGRLYQRVSPPSPELRGRNTDATDDEWANLLEPFAPRVYSDRVRLQDAVAWFEFVGWAPPETDAPPWLAEEEVKEGTRCPDCGKYYTQVKLHWAQSACTGGDESP